MIFRSRGRQRAVARLLRALYARAGQIRRKFSGIATQNEAEYGLVSGVNASRNCLVFAMVCDSMCGHASRAIWSNG